jgi:hypothetical protein
VDPSRIARRLALANPEHEVANVELGRHVFAAFLLRSIVPEEDLSSFNDSADKLPPGTRTGSSLTPALLTTTAGAFTHEAFEGFSVGATRSTIHAD